MYQPTWGNRYVAFDVEVLDHPLESLLSDIGGKHGLIVGPHPVEATAAEYLLADGIGFLGDDLYLVGLLGFGLHREC